MAAGIPSQRLSLGANAGSVHARVAAFIDTDFCNRLWSADHSLWTTEPAAEIDDRLGWLDLPETMTAPAAEFQQFADEVAADGIDHLVLLGMGGSSLAPEVFAETFGSKARLSVLDSTHPGAVASLAEEVALDRTLFVVASKSGTTIEPLSFLEFFWELSDGDGRHFAAITDPGTPLAELAHDRGFRRLFEATPDVGGRYSALTAFGLVPAAIVGAPIAKVLATAAAMRTMGRRCDDHNAPLMLGAALSELASDGRDKVTYLCSQSLAAFPSWVEQLIAESTGKAGNGIVPVAGEMVGPPSVYGDDRVFVYLALATDDDEEQAAAVDVLESAGSPTIRIEVADLSALGAEMYRAEYAVAAASAGLGIHPFNQPDVQAAKVLARQAMEGADLGDAAAVPVAEAAAAIAPLLGTIRPGDYISLLAFLHPTPTTTDLLSTLRHHLRDSTTAATTLGFGPRYLHSTGQLHKGGPDSGVFVQFVDTPATDLAVPNTDYSFGDLIGAQAAGDYAALRDAGRRVVQIDLGSEPEAALSALVQQLVSPSTTT